MSYQPTFTFTLHCGNESISVEGKTIDEIISMIQHAKSAGLALAFYKAELHNLSETHRKELLDIIKEYGTIDDLDNFFDADKGAKKDNEDDIIEEFFRENSTDPIEVPYDEPLDYYPFPPIQPVKHREYQFRDYYRYSRNLDPINALNYCIEHKLQGQAHILVELAKLKVTYRKKLVDYLVETRDLPGLIYYSKNVEKVDSDMLLKVTLELVDDPEEKDRINLHFYHAAQEITAPNVLEELCKQFIAKSQSANYASFIAAELSLKDEEDRILQRCIKLLEDFVVAHTCYCCEPLFRLISRVKTSDKKRLYKKMLDIRTAQDLTCGATDADEYIRKAAFYVPLRDRVLCRLSL